MLMPRKKIEHVPGLGTVMHILPDTVTVVIGYTAYGGVITRDIPYEEYVKLEERKKEAANHQTPK